MREKVWQAEQRDGGGRDLKDISKDLRELEVRPKAVKGINRNRGDGNRKVLGEPVWKTLDFPKKPLNF